MTTRLQNKLILRAKLLASGKGKPRQMWKLSGEIDALTYMYTCARCGNDTHVSPCPTCGEGAESYLSMEEKEHARRVAELEAHMGGPLTDEEMNDDSDLPF